MKRIAVQFYGHMRTYKYTYENFFKYIIRPNQNDGYEIDIFIHTWEQFNRDTKCWYNHSEAFPTLNNKLLTVNDIEDIKQTYQPKVFLLENLEKGVKGQISSFNKVTKLKLDYEALNGIKYDYIFKTRPDILFFREFRLDYYLELYNTHLELKGTLPEKFLFSSTSLFRLGVIDGRYTNEGDLAFFSNFDVEWEGVFRDNKVPRIFICCYGNDFTIFRERDLLNNVSNSESLISFNTLYGTAKQRIQNQLSYKLGQSMIINSKSIFGIIFMPIYLLSIFLTYKQEQKIYQEKIKKDPSLKLPPLESYPDYNEALKFKEHLSYKLGEALIKANNNWYRGGYIKLWFEIRRIKKEFKNKLNKN